MLTVAQKWLMGLLGLSALVVVVSNPKGFYSATNGVRQLIGGSTTDIMKAK